MNPLGPIRHTTIGVPTTTHHQVDARTAHYPALLTPDERERIITRCEITGGNHVSGPVAHGGTLTGYPITEQLLGADILNRLWHTVAHASQVTLGWHIPLDTAGFAVSSYGPGDRMGAHIDDDVRGNPPWDLPHRGLSISLPLNGGYQGGRLRLRDADGDWTTPDVNPGDAFVFGTSLEHEVLPVVSGRRWVLLFFAFTNFSQRLIR
ncbi:2OG-Fe(II) oxygenase [Micromonospora aurantiaca (nom. illeg.)]|uniref:2OG-Fe(II) oxygenase n=1 Tax=Micromonospora aurantiaca (nom. illeg.) TaxID=47850 RepID=UPI0037A6CCCB